MRVLPLERRLWPIATGYFNRLCFCLFYLNRGRQRADDSQPWDLPSYGQHPEWHGGLGEDDPQGHLGSFWWRSVYTQPCFFEFELNNMLTCWCYEICIKLPVAALEDWYHLTTISAFEQSTNCWLCALIPLTECILYVQRLCLTKHWKHKLQLPGAQWNKSVCACTIETGLSSNFQVQYRIYCQDAT